MSAGTPVPDRRDGAPGDMASDVPGEPVWLRVCDSGALIEGGDGLRFEVPMTGGTPVPAFVVRYDGQACGWVNRCQHVGVELDWQHGKFYDAAGLYLICATHGATYEPDTGRCIAGPCRGASLTPVPVCERDGAIWADLSNLAR